MLPCMRPIRQGTRAGEGEGRCKVLRSAELAGSDSGGAPNPWGVEGISWCLAYLYIDIFTHTHIYILAYGSYQEGIFIIHMVWGPHMYMLNNQTYDRFFGLPAVRCYHQEGASHHVTGFGSTKRSWTPCYHCAVQAAVWGLFWWVPFLKYINSLFRSCLFFEMHSYFCHMFSGKKLTYHKYGGTFWNIFWVVWCENIPGWRACTLPRT